MAFYGTWSCSLWEDQHWVSGASVIGCDCICRGRGIFKHPCVFASVSMHSCACVRMDARVLASRGFDLSGPGTFVVSHSW